MSARHKAHGRTAVGLLILLFPSLALAQPAGVTATATPDQKTVPLSGSVRVTLAVEGPAPLRVELPKQLLAPEADRDWKVQPAGPAAVAPLAGGREKWSQVLRLDPYVPGEAMYVGFAPVKVNGNEVTPAGFEVRVTTTTAEAKAEAARPVTPIEELPPPPIAPPPSPAWWWAAAGLLAAVVAVAAWRARHRPKPVPPREWAAAAFDRLERDTASGAALVEGVAAVVRAFVERRFGIPAPKLTTQELLAAAEAGGWQVEQTDPLRGLLEECDRAKFAGDVPDDAGCRGLLARGREWVNGVGPDPGPR